jgi:tetratricopeptide (TPR) repeat protein
MADSEGAFRLTFLQGRGLLSLGGRDFEGLGRVDTLELEIPNLRFPFDLSGGVARFKNRRLRLRELALFVGRRELTGFLRRAPLGDFGIFDPHVAVSGSRLTLTARVHIGGHESEMTISALVSSLPPCAVRLCIYDVRTYGFLPVPAPLVVTALLSALGADSPVAPKEDAALPPLLHMRSTADVCIDACELAMLAILPMHGWRLPERKHVQIRVAGGSAKATHVPLVFSLAEPGAAADVLLGEDANAEARAMREFTSRCEPVETALAQGDITSALTLLSALSPVETDDRVGTTRLLQLLLAATSSLHQAADVARAALGRWPDFAPAWLAQAVVAHVGGDWVEAAAHYEKVAQLSAAQGLTEDESCARVAAARALAASGQTDRALAALEQGLAVRSSLSPVGRARLLRQAVEGRWKELLPAIGEEAWVGDSGARDEVGQVLEVARQGGLDRDPGLIAQAAASLESLLARDVWPASSLGRADAAYQMGILRLTLGDEQAAAQWFATCIEGDASGGSATRAWQALVEIFHRRGDSASVVQSLAGWAGDARVPENAAQKVEHLLGAARIAWHDLHGPEQAAAYLESALTFAPGNEAVLAELEQLALQTGTLDGAIEILRRRLRDTRPDQGRQVLRLLIRLLVAVGHRQAEAREAGNVLTELFPDEQAGLPALLGGDSGGDGEGDPVARDLDLASALSLRPDGKQRAEEILRQLVERVPSDVAPLDALYQMLVERGDFSEAAAVFVRRLALTTEAAIPVLLVSRARLCLSQPEGLRAALAVLQSRPALALDDEALSLRADVASKAGDSVDAVLCLQSLRMRASDEARSDVTKRLTDVLSRPETAKDVAITMLETLQTEAPDDVGVAQALFEAYGRLEDAGARMRLWKELLAKAPTLPDVYRARLQMAMSEAAERDGDLQTAQKMLDEAAQLDGSPRTRVERLVANARLLVARGELPLAEDELEQALALDPAFAPALALLGDLAYGAQEWERARNLYTRLATTPGAAPELAPQTLAHRRAELAEMFGDHEEAEAAYREVIAADPTHDGAREALAGFAAVRGDLAEAALHLQEVVRLVPREAIDRLTRVRQRLGQVYLGLGDLQAARQNLELALASEPDRASTLELLATVYGRLGLHRDAASMCERLSRIETDPAKKAEALFRQGEVLRVSLGDAEGAADAYLRACDLDPGLASTLGRLVTYYWSRADLPSLADIGVDLVTANPNPKPDQDDLGLLVAMAALLSRHDEALAKSALDSALLGAPLRPEVAAKRFGELVTKVARGDWRTLDTVLSFVATTVAPGFKDELAKAAVQLLQSDPSDAGVAVLAGRLFEGRGQRALARAAYSLAHFIDPELGVAARLSEVGDEAWPRPDALAPGRAVHPLCRGPLRKILQHLARSLAGSAPPAYDEPTVPFAPATVAICEDLRSQLGAPAIPVVAQGRGADVTFTATQPMSLLIGRRAESLPAAELRFFVARAFEQARAGTMAVLRMSPDNLRGLLRAVLRIAGAPATPFEIAEEAADEATSLWLRRLRNPDLASLLPIAQHRDELLAEAGRGLAHPPDLDDYIRGCRYTADRIGLLACRQPQAALRALCGLHKKEGDIDTSTVPQRQEHLRSSQALHELVGFMLSDEYAALVSG